MVISCGASAVLDSAISGLAGEGDEVVTFSPFYPNYGSLTRKSGAQFKTVDIPKGDDNRYHYDFELFKNALTPKTQAVMLTNPHNPTGKVLTSEDIKTISEILDKYAPQAWVITDDVYNNLTFDGLKY